MFDSQYSVLMAQYNLYMNEKLYAMCAELSDEERRRDRGAFFKSIHGTLNHLPWGDRAFLIRLLKCRARGSHASRGRALESERSYRAALS